MKITAAGYLDKVSPRSGYGYQQLCEVCGSGQCKWAHPQGTGRGAAPPWPEMIRSSWHPSALNQIPLPFNTGNPDDFAFQHRHTRQPCLLSIHVWPLDLGDTLRPEQMANHDTVTSYMALQHVMCAALCLGTLVWYVAKFAASLLRKPEWVKTTRQSQAKQMHRHQCTSIARKS